MTQKLALVTGSNKGIGNAICKALALRYSGSHFARSSPASSQGPTPLLILCTARNPALGTAAVEKLREEIEAKDASALKNGLTELRFEQLDINDEQSRLRMKGVVEKLGGLDLLVNNAGIMPPGKLDGDLASSVIQTNYFSLRALTTLLTPLLNPGARVVNVSSTLGTLSGNSYSEALKDRFRKAASEGGKPEQVDELMQEFVDGAQYGSLAKSGWTTEKNADSISASLAYNVSKSGLSALTQALHNQHAGKQNIEWSSCCPGYVKTDLTRGGGFLTVDQGAKTPVKLALDDVLPEGGFWRQEKPAEWM